MTDGIWYVSWRCCIDCHSCAFFFCEQSYKSVVRDAQGFLLVFSVTRRDSLDHLRGEFMEVLRVKDREKYFPIVLVGNKCDFDAEREISMTGMPSSRIF